ncbi:MAG: helix-turn-helix domain-containing protein [Clostridia bacterium]|nr:helix-turn-helix domain-containing protein [Clostridia bacterium]
MEKPIYTKQKEIEATAEFSVSSPWKNEDVGFNWVTNGYPYLHNHNFWEIMVCFDGSIRHTINNYTYVMRPGDACIIRPEDKHMLRTDNGESQHINFLIKNRYMEKLLAVFDEGLADELYKINVLNFSVDKDELPGLFHKTTSLQTVSGFPLTKEILINCKLLITNLVQQYVFKLNSMDSAYPLWLKKLLIELDKREVFTLSIDEIVKLTPYSYSHLVQLFKKNVNMSLIEYLTAKRIEYAKNRLANTNDTTLQISMEAGYSSLSHFNHTFKSLTSKTPSEYRKYSKIKH